MLELMGPVRVLEGEVWPDWIPGVGLRVGSD